MIRFENIGVFIREKVWLVPNIFPYKYHNILNLVKLHTHPPMKMEHTVCSEKSANKIQTPGNNPEESIKRKLFTPY